MKKYSLIMFCFLNFSTLFAQTKIENKLTSEHVYATGTKISLIPPNGFIKAANFLGFQQNQSGSSIMILDVPAPFSQTSKGFTKAGFLSQGVEVKQIEKFTINDLPAILVTGEQNAGGNIYGKYVFAFGSEQETILINGAFPQNLEEVGKLIRTAILTTIYDGTKKINPFETVDFKVDLKGSKLRFAKSISNSLIFTVDGLVPTQSINKTSLFVSRSFYKVSIDDKKLFSLNRFKQLPFDIEKIETVEPVMIDDISGYEIIAIGKDKKNGNPEKIYQVILFSDSLYYILFGTTNNNYESNIVELKNLVKTFKRK